MRRILTALFLLIAPIAGAQTLPGYTEAYVNDFADMLPPGDEDDLRDKLIELKEQRDIEFTVVTVVALDDYGYDGALEAFATDLFNKWGVGNAQRNDGVMLLIAQVDRKLRIEVGSGYGSAQNDAMKEIIDDVIVPRFKRDDYVGGIQRGVDEVIHHLTGVWPGEFDASGSQQFMGTIWRGIQSLGLWIVAILAPFAAIPWVLYRKWQRHKPRVCPIDGTTMRRLDEVQDDLHLDPGQLTEEQLKSVDYDVWLCPKCGHTTVEGYNALLGKYSPCRSCGHRTAESNSQTLQAATYTSEGLRQVDYHCLNCGDSWSETVTIPRKERSESSSSGSFGGGSSSGGGASGSW